MARNLGINIKIGADLKKFSSDMQNVSRQMKRTGKKMQSLGKSMTMAFTVPLGLIGGASVKLAADFEQSMAKVKAISGATAAEFKSLTANALELGRTTRYTAAQVAQLQLNLSKLGFKPREITDATGAILDLALATGEDLAMSATTAAATIKGFGLTAKDSGRVADVMAKSFSSSALDLEKFSSAMSTVAPIAKIAGVSLEETTAILGALTDRGMDASTAGTSLRNIYLKLAEQGLSWGEAMAKVKDSADPLSTALKIFGVRASAASTIIANNADEIHNLTTELNNSAGSARAMAAIMDNTMQGSMLRLKSALQGIAIEIGTILTPVIRKLTDFITKVSEKFSGLSESTKRVIIVIAGIVAAAGPLVFIFGTILTILPAIVPALIALISPIGLVVAGLTAITIIITKNWSKIAPKLQEIANYFTEIYNESLLVRVAVNGIVLVFKILVTQVKAKLGMLWSIFKIFVGTTSELFKGFGNILKGALTLDFDDIKKGAGQINKALVSNLGEAFTEIRDDSKETANEIKSHWQDFSDSVNKVVKPIVIPAKLKIVGSGGDDDGGGVDPTGGKGKAGFDVLSVQAKNATKDLKLFGETAKQVGEPIKGLAYDMDGLVGEASQFSVSMVNATQQLVDGVKAIAIETFSGLFEAIGESIVGGEDAFKHFGENVLANIADFMSKFGALLIAGAIASKAMQDMLFKKPMVALAAGIALVAISGVMKGMSKKNPMGDTGSTPGPGGYNPSTFTSGMGSNSNVLTLETVVYGNDIVLSSNRQHGTVSRTRRK